MIRIYDYTHTFRHSYIIQQGGRAVLLDLELKTISASRTMMLFYLIAKCEGNRLKEDSKRYREVLKCYNSVLQRLPNNKATEGTLIMIL